MRFKLPKNSSEFKWTSHVKNKMMYYSISEQKIRSVLRAYDRREVGLAEGTVAVMKRNDTQKRKQELWVMYKETEAKKKRKQLVMISVWRYPGVTKKGDEIPVPEDVLEELKRIL
jgi:hypothetical protein